MVAGSPVDGDRLAPAPRRLLGRDAEVASVRRLLDRTGAGRGGVLVVRGAYGSGRSALLDHAGSMWPGRTLRADGCEAESAVALAGLGQLLSGAATAGWDALIAEIREGRGPVLCLIDDAHLWDGASLEVIAGSAEVLHAVPVAVIMATEACREPDVLRSAPGLRLPPLDRDTAAGLLDDLPDLGLPPGRRRQVLDLAAGNPGALTALAWTAATDDPGSSFAESGLSTASALSAEGFEDHYRARVEELGPQAAELLDHIVCAGPDAPPSLLRRLADAGFVDLGRCRGLEESGLLGPGAGLAHPLVARAVRRVRPSWRLRAASGHIAGLTDDPREAVLQRAAATLGEDDGLADALETAALDARREGDHEWAAQALSAAVPLSSTGRARGRLLVLAAESRWNSARPDLVPGLVRRARAETVDPATRARALLINGTFAFVRGFPGEAQRCFVDGAETAVRCGDPVAFELLGRGIEAAWWFGRRDWTGELARLVERVGEPADPTRGFLHALLTGGELTTDGDLVGAAEPLRAAIRLSRALDEPRAAVLAADAALLVGDPEVACAEHLRAVESLKAAGRLSELPSALRMSALTDVWRGESASASAHAREAEETATLIGEDHPTPLGLSVRAHIAALLGDVDDCRDLATTALRVASDERIASAAASALWALARLELGLGDPEAAVNRLVRITDPSAEHTHPLVALFAAPDLVEAAVRAGRREVAVAALGPFEKWARAGSPWAAAVRPRLAALLGPADGADALFEDSVARLTREGPRFDEARTRLLYGEHLRRTRRRAQARGELERAIILLEEIGSRPWAEHARRELAATGVKVRSRTSDPSTLLTVRERQIAELVVAGASNAEVSARLVLSRKTVEYHLHKAYTKLGIGSRARLADALAAETGGPTDAG
ncbi:LuxR C-terminal-related transcriptional regulator [Streptomyces sp. NPDC057257]|uniref:helix-turn-helix transcriptional regulator n=1 Tax=Streptomyces sp. NPDC057257 TaxID=3346071 RepID=UPI003627F185